MKQYTRAWVSAACLLGLLFSVNPVAAATTNEIETVFNWAENNYPELFPEHRTTQMIDPWAFRFYPSTGIYTGIKNDEVYVLGGPWGADSPTFIATLPSLLSQIQGTGGNGSVPACDSTAELPQGMVITQNGNVVNITTNGQCIVLPNSPENTNFCEPLAPPQPTGISVLSTVNTTSFQTTGITIDLPGFPNPLDTFAQDTSSCIINAQEDADNLVVNSNICFDVTNQFSSLPSVPGISINPPITVSTVSSSTSQRVPDCFATAASFITDAYTGETWINVNGSFVPSTDLGSGF
ncbi:hypothetical protein SAMN05216326_10619 [Nitrosomonas marina]|uniref:Uncharacterized protein n=1 Tax=Nitrosomonas marina TaxID=917 RepID=A0A1I0A3B2_9PROT|nr:hypothetical protein [Nitrosomonas marina]SES88628.1 hypothetical protein SAMN05216326_10619 [Nitrosomonas marina]